MGKRRGKPGDRDKDRDNGALLRKRSPRRERARPKKLKRAKVEFREDRGARAPSDLEALKEKIRKSKLEKKNKEDGKSVVKPKRERRREKTPKVKPVAKSRPGRAKPGPARRGKGARPGERRRRKRRRRGGRRRAAPTGPAASASSSSIDFSSMSDEETQRRRARPRRRRRRRRHFDTTSSSSDSGSDFNDLVDPRQREKQVRLARLRALKWEQMHTEKAQPSGSAEEVSFHGSVSLSDVEAGAGKSSDESAESAPEAPETDLVAEIEHQERVLAELQQNPDITAEAVELVKKNVEALREKAVRETEERLRRELDRKFEAEQVKEVNAPKQPKALKPNNISKLSAAEAPRQPDGVTFMIEKGFLDELESGLGAEGEGEAAPGARAAPEPEPRHRLAIVRLSENLKAKFGGAEDAGSGPAEVLGGAPPKKALRFEEETEEGGEEERGAAAEGGADPLEEYMSAIQAEAVEQEEFNYNAVRNNYLPIDQRKADVGGLKLEEEEEEVNVITGEELLALMKLDQKDGFNVPRKPGEATAARPEEDKAAGEAEEGAGAEEEEEEEEEAEYDATEQEFITALKNSTVLFGNQEEEAEAEAEAAAEAEKKSDGEFCDDNEVADQIHIEERLKKTGMESSSQKIDKIRSTYLEKKKKMEKKKMLKRVDHSSIIYEPIRKDLYRESSEIAGMTEAEVLAKRKELGDIKIRGANQVRPIFSWFHCGLPRRVLKLLVDKLHYRDPFPVQCQCIPIILSGRDCIGVAETGSGKTLAYVLPMLRHIKDQKPLEEGDGPVALVMVPTRELALQVFSTVRLFCKVVGLRAAAIFGGASLSSQFSELKKGAEVVVSTPGRLIDILTTSNGKITNLRRVTFIVLDEADRMFDLGFEPQINRIIGNVRPSRQTVLFSATFPRNVEALAKRILSKPLEVVVGTRGQASKNIQQKIEIIEEDQKLFRLLELLGIWTDRGSVIVFVDQQSQADALYQSLLKYKYVPLLLHGGQDQDDRSNTIADFKKHSKKVLITTSLGARGLDIKWVILVVNYYCPPFKEDYIHRIGRTGRAGRKGFAVTMITSEEDKFAGDLIQALQISNSEVPPALMEMHQKFREKVMRGEAQDFKNKNLGGRGFKFDHNELAKFRAIKKIISKQYGLAGRGAEDDEDVQYLKGLESSKKVEKTQIQLIRDPKVRNAIKKAAVKAAGEAIMAGKSNEDVMIAAQNAIRDFLFNYDPENPASFAGAGNDRELKIRSGILRHDEVVSKVSVEFEIDSYPEITRKKVTGRDYLAQIGELTCCQISVRGILSRGSGNVFGQKKLHIFIEGDTRVAVMNALYEINKTAEESAMNALSYGSAR